MENPTFATLGRQAGLGRDPRAAVETPGGRHEGPGGPARTLGELLRGPNSNAHLTWGRAAVHGYRSEFNNTPELLQASGRVN